MNSTMQNSDELQGKPKNTDWALGPGSVSWRVMRDPTVFILGQIRTSMLLLMHPPFAASTEHDTFLRDPILRFRRVGMYAYSVIFGAKADAERLSHMVRTRHSQVTGIEPITRRPYQSNSEYELALTQVIEKSSYLAIYDALHGALSEAERDQFYAEQRVPAAMLGIHPDHLPDTSKGTEAFLAAARKRFCVGQRGRSLLCYYDNQPYPKGTMLGDLPSPLRQLALLGVRLVADMAMGTLGYEDRLLLSINRSSVLHSKKLTRWVMKGASYVLNNTKLGERFWESYLQKRAYGLYTIALAEMNNPSPAPFVMPDVYRAFAPLSDIKRNWPGDPKNYALGRAADGEIDLSENPPINLRDTRCSLAANFASQGA